MQKNRALVLTLLTLIGTTHTGRNGKHNWTQAQQIHKHAIKKTTHRVLTLEERNRIKTERIDAHEKKLARNKEKREQKLEKLAATRELARAAKKINNPNEVETVPLDWEQHYQE